MEGSTDIDALASRANAIRETVAAAAERAGRAPEDVTIVAVSKTFPREAVEAAYELGFRVFGESRVQEIRQKYASPLPGDASIHMIGQLQTNKVRQVLPFVSCVETVDRSGLIDALGKELTKREQTLSVRLQVNVAGEEQKSGCNPSDAEDLLRQMLDVPNLRCDGLMTMAPLADDPEDVRPVFRGLRELRDRLQEATGSLLPILSMGMSNDFEIAVEEGATHVRIGRAIFGNR